jgi:hypothetical protein
MKPNDSNPEQVISSSVNGEVKQFNILWRAMIYNKHGTASYPNKPHETLLHRGKRIGIANEDIIRGHPEFAIRGRNSIISG